MSEYLFPGGGFPPLRDFQRRALTDIEENWKRVDRVMLMSPTGSGKTLVALSLIRDALADGKRCIFVCDRTVLIQQTASVAQVYGLPPFGIIQSDNPGFDLSRPFQIASAQTLARRNWPFAHLIVIDEAHTLLRAWTEHIIPSGAKVLGLSATPFSSLGGLFECLVVSDTMDHLTKAGILVPLRVRTCKQIDMRGAKTSGGEWTDLAVEERGARIVGDVVIEWSKHAAGRKTIVFGSTIAHCEAMTREFVSCGIRAALYTSLTSAQDRASLLKDFSGSLDVLVSVEAISKGFDIPAVSAIVDARPLRKSLSCALQMWGRGLRSGSGKDDCILLDHSGNIVRFSDDFADIYYHGLSELSDDKKKGKDSAIRKTKVRKACPACGFEALGSRCISCGYVPTRSSLVEHAAGVSEAFWFSDVQKKRDKQDLWEQCCSLARRAGNPNTARGRAAHLYRSITKQWPSGVTRFQDTPYRSPERAVLAQAEKNRREWKKSLLSPVVSA